MNGLFNRLAVQATSNRTERSVTIDIPNQGATRWPSILLLAAYFSISFSGVGHQTTPFTWSCLMEQRYEIQRPNYPTRQPRYMILRVLSGYHVSSAREVKTPFLSQSAARYVYVFSIN